MILCILLIYFRTSRYKWTICTCWWNTLLILSTIMLTHAGLLHYVIQTFWWNAEWSACLMVSVFNISRPPPWKQEWRVIIVVRLGVTNIKRFDILDELCLILFLMTTLRVYNNTLIKNDLTVYPICNGV